MADGTERFADAARDLGFEPEIGRFPDGTRTAADAAAAVGCELGQIVKSLVFVAGDQPVLVLTSGSNRVDERLVAAALGVDHVGKADAAMVRSATGFAIGGTPPFGHVGELVTLVDTDLFAHDVVWAAAGTPDSCFPIAPDRLAELAGGRRAAVAAAG
ncbi:MAG: YbaK/EbsC family protein [Acidimicrobiales bacterium]